jgi:hypothetical protein
MDPVSIIGLVFNIVTLVAKEEHRIEITTAKAQVEEKVIAYRVAKGSARRLLRAEIQQMVLPEAARPAQRALVSARTQWQIDLSAALVEREIGE